MDEIHVGVVGLGHNGRAWCEAYARNDRVDLVALCDRDEERLWSAANQYGGMPYSDDGIFEDERVDLISIHTPDHLHAEPFLKALDAGKHVMVEKPMADSIADLERMVASADRSGKTVMVGQVLRFNPLFRQVKKFIEDGVLGEIFYVEADYIHDLRYQRFMEEWKLTTEIPIVGGGCHPLDLLRWFVGEVEAVQAWGNAIAYEEMREETTLVATYRFESGCVGKVTALYAPISPMSHAYNLSVYGTKGTVWRDQLCLDGLHDWMPIPITYSGHPYDPEVDHLVTCILKNEQPLIDAHDGARTAAACICAAEAARTGKTVKIPRP